MSLFGGLRSIADNVLQIGEGGETEAQQLILALNRHFWVGAVSGSYTLKS